MFDLELGQRTKKIEWLKNRRKSIGGSDMPIILGLSPWKTPRELWQEKTSTDEPELTSNFAQARGIELEPEVRDLYERTYSLPMPARSFAHLEIPYFTCSMDGWNNEEHVGIEIKCPGAEDHNSAKNGVVPEKYIAQIEWQYFVTNAKRIDYVSYSGSDMVVIPVPPPSAEKKSYLMMKAAEFWHYVETKTPPPITEKDALSITTMEAISLGERYRDLTAQIKQLEAELEQTKEKILAKYKLHAKVNLGPITLSKSIRKGAIDYAKIPNLTNVDLESYRKKDSEVWSIRLNE
jgi:putative phage-type endonuclease